MASCSSVFKIVHGSKGKHNLSIIIKLSLFSQVIHSACLHEATVSQAEYASQCKDRPAHFRGAKRIAGGNSPESGSKTVVICPDAELWTRGIQSALSNTDGCLALHLCLEEN